MIGAKLRQIAFGLGQRSVTVGYPLAPLEPDPNVRGRVSVETDRCVGCGGCADVCPARCILITDLSPTRRVIRRILDRCILCGRCEEACAYDAVHVVADWETGTTKRSDLLIEQDLFMGVCDRCGRCYTPFHPLDVSRRTGMRVDEPALLHATPAGARSGAPDAAPEGEV